MHENLCDLHRQASRQSGPRVAIRFKRHGVHVDFSWNEYRRAVDRAAGGLISLGVQPGDRVGILSENRYEWLIADQAILGCGAVDVPLHAPLVPAQVAYQLAHSEACGVVLSGPEQASKIVQVLHELPNLKFVVSFDSVESISGVSSLSWNALLHTGRNYDVSAIRQRERQVTGDTLATIIYTSGTTGNPKGVMLTHANLLSNTSAMLDISGVGRDDVLLSWLPYSHIYARTVDHYLTTMAGTTLVLAESIDTLTADLALIRPTWLTSVPRFYEKVWSAASERDPDRRKQFLQDLFGPRVRQLTSGGAPLPRHVCEGFFKANIPLLEGYGLTESSPVISFNRLDSWRIGTVGQPLPNVEVRIADDGEILTRGPHVMRGYWKNTEATAEAIVDGWLMTGDVGHLDDDGFLTITDRKKDLIVTSGGKNVAPSEIERALVADPWIDQAVVHGDARPFITALLVLNVERARTDSELPDEEFSTEGRFLTASRLYELVEARVNDHMSRFSRPEHVRRFLLLNSPFTVEADELTATLKVKRRHIIARYQQQLDRLYD